MALDNLITMVKYIFVYDNFKDPIIRILVTTNVLMLNVAIYIVHILMIIDDKYDCSFFDISVDTYHDWQEVGFDVLGKDT